MPNSAQPHTSFDSQVRVRFAPSPTGYLHVGGVRAMLFNWLYAKKTGGKLILRIEDTDRERSTIENQNMMMADIKSLNLDYQEGPDVDGDVGPYRQSDRFQIYIDHASQLFEQDKAYFCFATDEEIKAKREVALKTGRPPEFADAKTKISKEDAIKRMKAGEKGALRMRAPKKDFICEDMIRGAVTFRAGTVGDFLITRSPYNKDEAEISGGIGMPVYNFACVIDDHLMKMTHVIRGEDHLSNTAKQLMIFDAFGWSTPKFVHTAMVLGGDRQKLSKRNGDVSARDYINKGYLPDALINFLALLGWWPSSEIKPKSGHPEILDRDELIQAFEISGLQKSPAVFDMKKLDWMNGFYIRNTPLDEIVDLARPFFESHPTVGGLLKSQSSDWLSRVIDLVRGEVSSLSELPLLAVPFFDLPVEMEAEAQAIIESEDAKKVIRSFKDAVTNLDDSKWNIESFTAITKDIQKSQSVKGKGLFMPIRISMTGKVHGPDLKGIFELLGPSLTRRRVSDVESKV